MFKLNSEEKTRPKHPGGRNVFIGFGIKKYKPHQSDLNNSVKDLHDVMEILIAEFNFSENDCFVLEDEAATRGGIENRLKALIEKNEIGRDDNLILYFSGHGVWDPTWEQSYFIPYVPEGNKVESTSAYLSSKDLIGVFLPKIPCFHLLVILDCCFAGGFAKEANNSNKDFGFTPTTNKPSEHLQNVFSKKSRYIITSGWLNTVSDGKGGENSPFAKALIRCLRDSDDINLLTLFNSVSALATLNKGSAVSPMPFDDANHEGGEFVFFRNDSGKPVPKELKDAFLELNFTSQEAQILSFPKRFNLVYINGTQRCGHHLLVCRFFKKRKRTVDILNKVPYNLRCGAKEFDAPHNNNLWQLCSNQYCFSTSMDSNKLTINGNSLEAELNEIEQKEAEERERVVKGMFEKIKAENSLLMIKVEEDANGNIDEQVLKFWSELNKELAEGNHDVPEHDNRFYLIFLDKRGGKSILDMDKFKVATTSPLAKLIPFAPIQQLDVEEDLKNWADIYKHEITAERFKSLTFEDVPPKVYLENAIKYISEKCGRMECYDELFFNHWKHIP